MEKSLGIFLQALPMQQAYLGTQEEGPLLAFSSCEQEGNSY